MAQSEEKMNCLQNALVIIYLSWYQPQAGTSEPTRHAMEQRGLAIILFISHTRHTRAPARGKQSLAWSDEEDKLLAERFGNDSNITQVAKLNFRTYM